MRYDNVNFSDKNNTLTKEPIYVFEISWDFANTDVSYFTSNKYAELPTAATSIFMGVLQGMSSTSQKLDPLKANASIGSLDFSIVDIGATLSNLLNTKLITEQKGVRRKRVRVYLGYQGIAWADYTLLTTQHIDAMSYKDGMYSFKCTDIQREKRKTIFDLRKTSLLNTVFSDMRPIDLSVPSVNRYYSETWDIAQVLGGQGKTIGDLILVSGMTNATNNGYKTIAAYGTAGSGFYIDVTDTLVVDTLGVSAKIQQGTLACDDNSEFEMMRHDVGFTEDVNTNTDIGYLTIDEEVLSYLEINTRNNTQYFDKITRSLFGTQSITHSVDLTVSAEKRTEIAEYIYIEMPAVRLAYAILTGAIHGQVGVSLPSNWHLGIDSANVSLPHFENIGTHVWDHAGPNPYLDGNIVTFHGLEKQDGKSFLEKEIYLLLGLFSPVLSTGELALKRLQPIHGTTDYDKHMYNNSIISYTDLVYDTSQVYNTFSVRWNWSPNKGEYTRTATIIDDTSISTHGRANSFELKFKGLHGYTHTRRNLLALTDNIKSRYVGPPLLLSVECLGIHNDVEIGDVIKVTLGEIRDHTGAISYLDRSFEVQSVSIDWVSGKVNLGLFGTSQVPDKTIAIEDTVVLPNTMYTTGTLLPTAVAGQLDDGTVLTGSADINSSIWYYDGDLTIPSNTTLTIHDNVQLRVNGLLTINGNVVGTGNGVSGSTVAGTTKDANGFYIANSTGATGSSGGMGNTKAEAGASLYWGGNVYKSTSAGQSHIRIAGAESNALALSFSRADKPSLIRATHLMKNSRAKYVGNNALSLISNIIWDGTALTGIPNDLRGSGGGVGGQAYIEETGINDKSTWVKAPGGDGGDGGAGLLVVCKGLVFGASGNINLSGAVGTAGANTTTIAMTYGESLSWGAGGGATGITAYSPKSGGGAGGSAGGFLVLLDGGTTFANIPNMSTSVFTATSIGCINSYQAEVGDIGSGYGAEDRYLVNYAWAPIIDGTIISEVDTPEEALVPSSITVVHNNNLPQTAAQNLVTLNISVTPPSPIGSYAYSNIYYRINQTTGPYILVGSADNSTTLTLSMDGTSYEIIAKPVSTGANNTAVVEGEEFVSTIQTVTTAVGGVTVPTGGFIASGPDIAAAGGVGILDNGIYGYGDDPLNPGNIVEKIHIDASTGVMTAVNVVLSGTVTATAGVIGGWAINTDELTSTTGTAPNRKTITLDPSLGGTPTITLSDETTSRSTVLTDGSITTDHITANVGGLIGGWSISAGILSSGNLSLDASNTKIRAGGAFDDYVEIRDTGIFGNSIALGPTFTLPSDGSAPTFSSGIINTTVFNITSSAVLETSPNTGQGAATPAGVRINPNGIYAYAANTSTPSVFIDANTSDFLLAGANGSLTWVGNTGDLTINGSIDTTAAGTATGVQVEVDPDIPFKVLDTSLNEMFTLQSANWATAADPICVIDGTNRIRSLDVRLVAGEGLEVGGALMMAFINNITTPTPFRAGGVLYSVGDNPATFNSTSTTEAYVQYGVSGILSAYPTVANHMNGGTFVAHLTRNATTSIGAHLLLSTTTIDTGTPTHACINGAVTADANGDIFKYANNSWGPVHGTTMLSTPVELHSSGAILAWTAFSNAFLSNNKAKFAIVKAFSYVAVTTSASANMQLWIAGYTTPQVQTNGTRTVEALAQSDGTNTALGSDSNTFTVRLDPITYAFDAKVTKTGTSTGNLDLQLIGYIK